MSNEFQVKDTVNLLICSFCLSTACMVAFHNYVTAQKLETVLNEVILIVDQQVQYRYDANNTVTFTSEQSSGRQHY